MKRICAWCQKVLSEGTLPASHGICDACYGQIMNKGFKYSK